MMKSALGQPSKLFVEVTTRCNLNCFMCVKQNCDLIEGNMSADTFAALQPALPHITALVLNGIGEPLLHPLLDDFIRLAKRMMPDGSWIGFQTNGVLLTQERAVSLLESGLDRICLSIDAISPETFRKVRDGGDLDDICDAFSAIAAAKAQSGRTDFQTGVEFVVMQSNLHELPAALAWAADRGASFALVTHALPYDAKHAEQSLYGECTEEALLLFEKWQAEAEREGIDLYRYFEVVMKYARTREDKRLVTLVESMKSEAEKDGIFLDLKRLLRLDWRRKTEVSAVFEKAQQVADQCGLDLKLPAVVIKEKRSCGFVEEGSAFISWDGGVSPCYFLWHRYRCFASGWSQQVQVKEFGNVNDRGILDIWHGHAFGAFRQGVVAYDYPQCSSCSLAPCDYVQTDHFEQDCHISAVPCGACLWCTGVFQCLS